ncbi:choline dehydrogenase [Fusarium bulbicola]|nr:choline dehydrogenase [Fusarium bulbicola]
MLFKDGQNGKLQAYRVKYLKGKGLYSANKRYDESKPGRLINVTASREVIVAGSAFNTPQILKLSGISPQEELESLEIPVIIDLPAVGDRDLQAVQEGVEHTMHIFKATGKPYAPFKVIEPWPGVSIRQGIMDNAFGHHATSSCRMGLAGDRNYCVDSEFKVNGVDGLRVMDASIFPRTPGGFPAAPAFMISQKAFRVMMGSIKG